MWEKRREEKSENCTPGGAPKTNMDINEVGFYEDQKIFEKTSKLKGSTIIIEENNTVVVNMKNREKIKL